MKPVDQPRLLALAWAFLRIGALAFGGLGATLALIQSQLVRRQRIVSHAELTEALTYTKLLPGSTVVQIVAYLGARLGGWLGSAIATAAFLLPSVAAMLVLAYGYAGLSTIAALGPALRGLLAAVVGLLIVATYHLARPIVTTPFACGLAITAFSLGLAFRMNPAWIVIGAGIVGVLARRGRG